MIKKLKKMVETDIVQEVLAQITRAFRARNSAAACCTNLDRADRVAEGALLAAMSIGNSRSQ